MPGEHTVVGPDGIIVATGNDDMVTVTVDDPIQPAELVTDSE